MFENPTDDVQMRSTSDLNESMKTGESLRLERFSMQTCFRKLVDTEKYRGKKLLQHYAFFAHYSETLNSGRSNLILMQISFFFQREHDWKRVLMNGMAWILHQLRSRT